ncbi:gag-protease polyprotein [Trifolium repens]|nr:gag-protease polyprotein [Trifolium repens]
MVSFLIGSHYDVWEAIEEGPFVPTHIVDGVAKEKPKSQWTDDEKKKVRRDMKAKHFILSALSYEQFGRVSHCESAQEVWNSLLDIHEGTGAAKIARIDLLTVQYERFCMKPGESIRDMKMRFYDLVNHLDSLGKKISNVDRVYPVLRSLSGNWRPKVKTIEKSENLSTMMLNTLFRELEEHEQIELNRLDEKKETRKKKKDSDRAAASSRNNDEEDDCDDSKEFDWHIKRIAKLLKKKNDGGRVAASSRNNDEEDGSGDSKEIEWHFKRIVKLLKKMNFKKGKKEHKKRGSASTRDTML